MLQKSRASTESYSTESLKVGHRSGLTTYLQAGLLAAIATLIHGYYAHYHLPLLTPISALLLFTTVLFLEARQALFALAIFTIGCLFIPNMPFETARLVIFSSALLAVETSKIFLPPFICNLAMWILLLMLPALTGRQYAGTQWDANLWAQVLIEITGITILGLLRFSHAVRSLFRIEKHEVDSKTFFVHVLSLTVLICVVAASLTALAFTSLTAERLVAELTAAGPRLVIFLSAILLVPVLAGLFISSMLGDYLQHLRLLVSGDFRLLADARDPLPVTELSQTLAEVKQATSRVHESLRHSEVNVRHLSAEILQNEALIREREIIAQNLVLLMDAAPWGSIACTTRGHIIAANQNFLALLNLKQASLIGQPITALNANHNWNKEIVSWLTECCRKADSLKPGESLSRFTSAANNFYLELRLVVAKSEAFTTTPSAVPLQSDLALILFVRKLADIRDFQLRLIAPSDFELLGSQLHELNRTLTNQLGSAVGQLSMSKEILTGLIDQSGLPLIQTQQGADLSLALREVDSSIRKSISELSQLEERSTQSLADGSEAINFSKWILNATNYLFNLLSLPQAPSLFNIDEKNSAQIALDENSAIESDIFLLGSFNEVSRLCSYLICFLRWVVPQANQLQLSLGYEEFSEETAKFLAGCSPGRYARLMIEHKGQSVSAKIMNPKYQHSLLTAKQNGIEVAFTLLSLEVKRMAGFVSLQSSSARGTTITIYLPINRAQRDAAAEASRSQQKRGAMETEFNFTEQTTNEVLVVTENEQTISALASMLRHLGYQGLALHPGTVQDDLGERLDFGGTGFGALDGIGPQDSLFGGGSKSGTDYHKFGLVLLDAEQTPHELSTVLRLLKQNVPQATTLLMTGQNTELNGNLGMYPQLRKPFDVQSLDLALKEALRAI